MAIWDDGIKIPNIEMKTMGGEVFWENIEESGGYRLQKNIVFGNCRILNTDDIRLDYGSEISMRAKFHQLVNNINHAVMGDVICVHRMAGGYDHYGVYKDDQCVYEYNLNKSARRIDIHKVSLDEFVGKDKSYSILVFPECEGDPTKIKISGSKRNFIGGYSFVANEHSNESLIDVLLYISRLKNQNAEYHLYSPEETIKRAESKLGEREYNLFFNNCEYYAIWCKTGLWESHQIEGLVLKIGGLMKCIEKKVTNHQKQPNI